MITGGWASFGIGELDSTELYDPSTGHWRMSSALPSARYGLRAATVDSRVIVFGETLNEASLSLYNHGFYVCMYVGAPGTSVLEFDPLGETFTEVGHTSQDHGRYFAVSVIKFSDYLDWCMY